MKKIIIYLLLLTLFVQIITGCQSGENSPVALTLSNPLLEGYSDSALEFIYDQKYQLSASDTDITPAETATVEFEGEKYSGTYCYTSSTAQVSYNRYVYRGEKDGRSYTFKLHSVTGEFCGFSWIGGSTLSGGKKLSPEECQKIADEFFKKYHADSLFTLTKTQEIGNIYIFDYTRSVENIPTAECISIWTNLEGKFVGYSKCLLDELDKEYDFSKVDLSAATQTIYQKLDTMSTVVKEKYDEIKYAEPSYTLTVLKDGRLALYCEASVEFITNITEDCT